MKIIDTLKFNKEILLKYESLGIKLADCRYIDLYSEYDSMRTLGYKITYIAKKMSEKYKISVRKVYQLVSEFEKDCTDCAV